MFIEAVDGRIYHIGLFFRNLDDIVHANSHGFSIGVKVKHRPNGIHILSAEGHFNNLAAIVAKGTAIVVFYVLLIHIIYKLTHIVRYYREHKQRPPGTHIYYALVHHFCQHQNPKSG